MKFILGVCVGLALAAGLVVYLLRRYVINKSELSVENSELRKEISNWKYECQRLQSTIVSTAAALAALVNTGIENLKRATTPVVEGELLKR